MKIGYKVRTLVWLNTTGEYVLGLNKGDYVYGVIHQIKRKYDKKLQTRRKIKRNGC